MEGTAAAFEIWMIEVVNRVSQAQHNGPSVLEFANGDAIANLMDEDLAKGSRQCEIPVLV